MKKILILGVLLTGCSVFDDIDEDMKNSRELYYSGKKAVAELRKLECIESGGVYLVKEEYDIRSPNRINIVHWECMNSFIKSDE